MIIFLILGLGIVHSQQSSGQDIVVKSIAPMESINSPAEELMALLDQSGSTLYFTRVGHEKNFGGAGSGSDIWSLQLDWANNQPTNQLANWNNRENNALVGFSADGTTVYLLNASSKQEGIAFSRKLSSGWTVPEVVPIPGLVPGGFKGFFMSSNYQYLLISMSAPGNLGNEDLYVSTKQPNGKWSKPQNLGASINSSGFEISPFLANDNKTLYFSSDGQKGYGGADVYVSERLYDSWDVWTKPVNLGKPINSQGFDAYFSIYDSVAYLSSNREGGLCDIYKVNLSGSPTQRERASDRADQILTDSEILALFGFIFDPLIEFEKSSGELSAKDKELLWFIAEKLSKRVDVQIGLSHRSDTNSFRRRKIQVITEYLATLNFPMDRVDNDWLTSQAPVIKSDNKEGVQLIFFKLK